MKSSLIWRLIPFLFMVSIAPALGAEQDSKTALVCQQIAALKAPPAAQVARPLSVIEGAMAGDQQPDALNMPPPAVSGQKVPLLSSSDLRQQLNISPPQILTQAQQSTSPPQIFTHGQQSISPPQILAQAQQPTGPLLTALLPAGVPGGNLPVTTAGGQAKAGAKISQAGDAGVQTPQLRGSQPPPPQAVSAPPLSSAGKPSVLGVIYKNAKEILERNFSMPGYKPPISTPMFRRAPPPGLDPVFPSTEFIGTNAQAPMGVNDNNYAYYPLEKMLWRSCPIMAKLRIRAYGWINPGYNYGTSHHSNYPMSYIVASRSLHWDQIVMRFERVPDTVQQKHMDWGFRFTSLYGEDYRFTLSKGWLSNQLLKYNYLTGWDPCECFGLLYVPKIGHKKIFDGLSIRFGRYISCPDIEAQLAPDNYLFTHSLMFTVDTYTQTGVQTWFQLNKYWNLMLGFHGGADTAPWTNSTVPTAQFLLRWVSRTNKNSVYLGINDLNGLPFRNPIPGQKGKDNLQQANINFTHVFNRRCHTVTEMYYLWTRNALEGGTVNNGPVRPYGGGGGPGAYLPGYSQAIGLVNYTLFKMTDKDYLTLRPVDLLADPRGWRTGYPTEYMSGTIGWCHRFSDTLCIRPEFRIERSLRGNVTPYDNGKRVGQATFACDLIQRF